MLYHWATETPRWARFITKFMIRVLHTASISNVDGVMFVDLEIREMVSFELDKEMKEMIFL